MGHSLFKKILACPHLRILYLCRDMKLHFLPFLIPFLLMGVFNPLKADEGAFEKSTLRAGDGLRFIENKGQIRDSKNEERQDVLFKSDGGGIDAFLRKDGFSYILNNLSELIWQTNKEVKLKSKVSDQIKISTREKLEKELGLKTINGCRIDINFVNPNPIYEILKEEVSEGYNTYYTNGSNILDVRQYRRITYKNIYEGVDIVFYGSLGGQLKYDIKIKAGADIRLIKFKITGVNGLMTNGDTLYFQNSFRNLKEFIPQSFQTKNTLVIPRKVKYTVIKNSENAFEMGFEIENYDKLLPLTIDPINYWITYFGGNCIDLPASITTDNSGNALICGYTCSNNFPVSVGAFQTVFSTFGFSSYIVKLTSSGTRQWATYFQSAIPISSGAAIMDIACDNLGNIAVVGSIKDNTLPVTSGCYQNMLRGPSDNFVAKFDPTGIMLWCSYFGGDGLEVGFGNFLGGCTSIDCDNNNNVIICGMTDSLGISTPGVFQSSFGGNPSHSSPYDAYVAKFTSGGILSWATFAGGNQEEASADVECDAHNNIILLGATFSPNFPTSVGCFQNIRKGLTDDFILKLDPTGNLIFSTLIGGTETTKEQSNSLAIDRSNNIVILGWTNAPDFPVSVGAYQSTFGGGYEDNTISKFSPSGILLWSTYYGSSYYEWPGGIATDSKNHVIIIGEWEDDIFVNLPDSGCAFQNTFGGLEDQFILKFDSAGKFNCFSYLGGPDEDDLDDEVHALASHNNFLYFITLCKGIHFPVTNNAYQFNAPNLNYNQVFGKLCAAGCGDTSELQANFNAPTSVCDTIAVQFISTISPCDSESTQYQWIFLGGNPASSTIKNPLTTFSSPGVHNVQLTVSNSCGSDSIIKTITVNSCIFATTVNNSTICSTFCASVQVNWLYGTAPFTFSWLPNIGNGPGPYSVCPSVSTIYSVTVEDANGFTSNATSSVTVQATPTLSINSGYVCQGQSFTFTATGANSYTWSPAGTLNNIYGPVVIATPSLTTYYNVLASSTNGCTVTTNVPLIVSTIEAGLSVNPLIGDAPLPVNLTDQSTGGTIYNIDFGDGTNNASFISQHTYIIPGVYNLFMVVADSKGCTDTVSFLLQINENCNISKVIPNIFSPNNDNINDNFFIPGDCFNSLQINIFDRWGKEVYSISTPTGKWDGNSLGKKCSEGTYYYILHAKYTNGSNYDQKGFVELVR